MKILLGICGFGNGHSARQAEVLKVLLERGHQVALMGFLNSERYFQQHFPQVPLYKIHVPIIHVSSETGIDFGRTAAEPFNFYDDGNAMNFGAMQQTLDYFGGKPDLVLSDYELVCAQFAYALDIPLITIDQQSKFAGFQFPIIDGFNRLEEKSRLRMFFPHAELRIATSFFEVPWEADPRFSVTLIPPILRGEFLAAQASRSPQPNAREVVVYFSPHGSLKQSLEEVYGIFAAFPDKRFTVFQRKPQENFTNIAFRKFDTADFIAAVSGAEAVITTGGHNLLSELAFLKKPVYTLPFDTFDQRCCADIIQRNELGIGNIYISRESLGDFFEQLGKFQMNMEQRRGLAKTFNGIEVLMRELTAFGV